MTTEAKKKRQFSKVHPKHKAALCALAEKHGQKWVADRIGITASGVSRLVQPGNSGVRPGTLEAIVELVGRNGVHAESAPARRDARATTVGGSFAAVAEIMAVVAKLAPSQRLLVIDFVRKFLTENDA